MTEPPESVGPAAAAPPDGCPVRMFVGSCDRPIHSAPAHDQTPVCLMHSRDPEKSDAAFQAEFDAILKAAAAEQDTVADFTEFVFPMASYRSRKFSAKCMFTRAAFTQKATFMRARFTQEADFSSATFTQRADFSFATFKQSADFFDAKFTQKANFLVATFKQDANFFSARFTQDADFSGSTFTQRASFSGATFIQVADFTGAKVLGLVEFRETKFRRDSELIPGPVFSLAQCSHPEGIVFYKTYLGQALFHNCDVSKLTFSSVAWRTRKGSGKRMLFEEEVDLYAAGALKPRMDSSDDRDYSLIAELYQQLKKSYDERKDYWTAGDFHYGELEMKRLHSQRRNPLARWLHRNLGLVACYKYASEYGESYMRPVLALMIVLAIFTLLFPLAGLDSGGKAPQSPPPTAAIELSYRHFADFLNAYPGSKRCGRAAFFGHSLMTALSVAAFQKELRYEPSYPWGRALALLELLLTSTLIALFLLAMRRQFKR